MNGTELPMTNATSPVNATVVAYRGNWIVSMVFTFLAAPWLAYVTMAMTYYNCRKKIFVCPSDKASRKFSSRKGGKGARILNILLVVSAWFALIYVLMELPLVSLPPPTKFCTVYHRIKQISYGVCLVSVYLTLWFRVFTAFYWDKIAKNSAGPFARFFNIFAIAFLMVITVANYAVFLSGPTYSTEVYGCGPVVSTKGDRLRWVILGSTTIVCQLIMLASLIYPLHLHRKKMLGRGFNSKDIIPLIRRSVAMTCLCIASDIVTSVFATTYKGNTVYLNHVVLSTNLLINITCVICSFSDHREKLFPFPCCAPLIPARRLSTSSTRTRHSQTTFKRGRCSSVTTMA